MKVWVLVKTTSDSVGCTMLGVFDSKEKAFSEMTKHYKNECEGDLKEMIEYNDIIEKVGQAVIVYPDDETNFDIYEEEVK